MLFSGPMVVALLQGRKVQTRRVVRPQPDPHMVEHGNAFRHPRRLGRTIGDLERVPCPYGKKGDRLWVRETWGYALPDSIRYKADAAERVVRPPQKQVIPNHKLNGWKPSIHMPRWASRLTLELEEVRVERLQEISEEDAKAEGIEPVEFEGKTFWRNYEFKTAHPSRKVRVTDEEHRVKAFICAGASFRSLWNSINGVGSWDANPWVWVLGFRLVPVG